MSLNNILDQMDRYKQNIPSINTRIFFSGAYGTILRIHYTLGHKTIFKEFRKFVIISSNFSNHTRVKLEINYKKKLETI